MNTLVKNWGDDQGKSLSLIQNEGELWIDYDSYKIPCPLLSQPAVISEKVSGYGKIGDYIKYHSRRTLFASPIRECVFGAIGKPCQFCTFNMVKPCPLPPDVFRDMFNIVRDGRSDVSLAIGPGTPNLNDHGIGYICKVIEKLRYDWVGTVSVELVPPHEILALDRLIDVGVGSIIMSIEIWNDEQRHLICPGKSYVSKQHYTDAWRHAVSRLGRGKVSSVLLVGLDKDDEVRAGIDKMCEIGVVPTLVPFRPYRHTPLSSHSGADHNSYLRLSRYNVEVMARSKINPKQQVGCTECGGCSLDVEPLEKFHQ